MGLIYVWVSNALLYKLQCIVSGEENLKNWPFPWDCGTLPGPSHGDMQHARKKFGKDHVWFGKYAYLL